MAFVFELTAYPVEALQPQVRAALQARTELQSRERMPGLWARIDKNRAEGKERKISSKTLSYITIALGVLLAVPGLTDPGKLLLPLIAGVFGILWGLRGLRPKRDSYGEAAAKLLRGKDQLESGKYRVIFEDNRMEIREGEQVQRVLYQDFERAIETEDLWCLVFQNRITLLQKSDLEGAPEEFSAFLQSKMKFTAK